jgi:CheY-like chemotaxis protein
VGQLAAGIAHDFNNIMATIILYIRLLQQAEGLRDRDRERLATINQQAWHATRMIEQILDFSRRTILERRPIDLLPLLKEQIKLLKHTLPEHIQIDLDYEQDEYTIRADPTRMQQVLTNLAVNARDAMPEGGHLYIALERLVVEGDLASPLPEMDPGDWIRVMVSDTGTGIPVDVLPHIFEPFFTTKAPGEGSGLGLAQVHGIVGLHGGHIDVDTHVGQGTTFMIYLPALKVRLAAVSFPDIATMPHGQGQVILIVEDSDEVRDALQASLEELNYQVLAVPNGQEALSLMEERGPHVDLVLSDVVMPVMGGIALFHALRKKGWYMPVILLTGHAMDEELEALCEKGLASWLAKPPKFERLAQEITRALRA